MSDRPAWADTAAPSAPPAWAGDPKSVPDSAPASPASAKPEAAPASVGQKVEGALEAGVGLAQGLVGGAAGQVTALGSAFTPGNYGTPEGASRAQATGAKVRDWISNLFTPGAKGKEYIEKIAHAIDSSKVAGLGPVFGPEMMALGAGPGGARRAVEAAAGSPEAEAVKAAAEKVGMSAKSAATTAKTFGEDLVGAKVKPAKAEATKTARGVVEAGAEDLTKKGEQDALRVKAMGDVTARLEREQAAAEAKNGPPPTLDAQGGEIRDTFTQAMDGAKKARAERADSEFEQVKQMALEKEASGERVNTAPIEEELTKAIETAAGIPDLENGLKKMLSAVKLSDEQAEAATVSARQFKGQSLLDVIMKKGGINKAEMLDITGEGRTGEGVKIRPGLFNAKGRGLDELAVDLAAEGWDIPVGDVDGGVQALRDMLRSEVDGRKFYSMADTERLMEHQAGQRAAQESLAAGKTFEQLELARRYLNDVGYSSELEGFPAIVRSQARHTAKAIDHAMQEFVPEFGAYKDNYRKMSEPLESLTTRFGKAVTATEGGMGETAYSKVANSDLPTRLFSRKEGIDILVDALSGGKNAEPAARQQAEMHVSAMVTNWIMESLRQKSPTAALEHLQSPQMRSTLSGLPKVEDALKKSFGDLASLDRTKDQLTQFGKDLGARGKSLSEAGEKMKTQLAMADDLAKQPGKTSQKKAFDAYSSALDAARKANAIPEEQYRATLALIDRAQTLEEKSALARKVVGGIALAAGGFKAATYLGF